MSPSRGLLAEPLRQEALPRSALSRCGWQVLTVLSLLTGFGIAVLLGRSSVPTARERRWHDTAIEEPAVTSALQFMPPVRHRLDGTKPELRPGHAHHVLPALTASARTWQDFFPQPLQIWQPAQPAGVRQYVRSIPAGVSESSGPGLPPLTQQRYTGKVKSYNKFKGWGFLECPESLEAYGRNILFTSEDKLDGHEARPGDEVTFRVFSGPKGPVAKDLEFLERTSSLDVAVAEAPMTSAAVDVAPQAPDLEQEIFHGLEDHHLREFHPQLEDQNAPAREMRLPEQVHSILVEHLHPGDLAIDATAGNGYDTLVLAQRVGPGGRVIAIDIQARAVDQARQRLKKFSCLDQVTLVRDDHAVALQALCSQEKELKGRISAITFNLGYLSGADKAMGLWATRSHTTQKALEFSTELLRPGGALFVIARLGEDAIGEEEATAVGAWMDTIAGDGWNVEVFTKKRRARPASRLWVAYKPESSRL